jgi:hypothetical protein
MTLKPDKNWTEAEATLPVNSRSMLRQLREDYVVAGRLYVPRYTGGPSSKILAELIRQGWRKEEKSKSV